MLSIIVITLNSRGHIAACLDSIYCQLVEGGEVIVVDNGSVDGTAELIRSRYLKARLIENRDNGGACKARNQGLACAVGEWVLTLDSDVVLADHFIDRFVANRARLTDDIGMLQPNILNIDGHTIYSNGIVLSRWRRFYDLNRGRVNGAARAGTIIGPCAAAAFYRRRMLEQLKEQTGYFDERFFFLVEDVDLAWRAVRQGWRVEFCPDMVCRHRGNGSDTEQALRQYLSFRNRHMMISKNESLWGRFMVYLIAVPYELARLIYLSIFNRFMWRHDEYCGKVNT